MKKIFLSNVGLAIGAIVGVVTLATGATRFMVSAANAHFVPRDSFVVYQQAQALKRAADSSDNVRRDELLHRVDSRVGAIYCASLPASKRAGCQ